jgi:hypothetical protein
MDFKLTTDARHWFRYLLQNPKVGLGSAPMFDLYSLCALVGMAKQRLEEPADRDAGELVDHFPQDHAATRRIFIAYFLLTECKLDGVTVANRMALNGHLVRLLQQDCPSHLTQFAVTRLNGYSYGGFLELRQLLADEEPRNLALFLIAVEGILNENP